MHARTHTRLYFRIITLFCSPQLYLFACSCNQVSSSDFLCKMLSASLYSIPISFLHSFSLDCVNMFPVDVAWRPPPSLWPPNPSPLSSSTEKQTSKRQMSNINSHGPEKPCAKKMCLLSDSQESKRPWADV